MDYSFLLVLVPISNQKCHSVGFSRSAIEKGKGSSMRTFLPQEENEEQVNAVSEESGH